MDGVPLMLHAMTRCDAEDGVPLVARVFDAPVAESLTVSVDARSRLAVDGPDGPRLHTLFVPPHAWVIGRFTVADRHQLEPGDGTTVDTTSAARVAAAVVVTMFDVGVARTSREAPPK
jgi:hypothetical protein